MPTPLAKGANAPVTDGKLVIAVSHKGPDTDLSALLLTAAGKVRTDDDLIFYGQPKSACGSVAYVDKKNQDGGYRHELSVAPSAVPATLDKIALTLTIDPTTTATFKKVTGLTISIFEDKGGTLNELVTIQAEGANETALILGELYRRNGAWKIRHIAQGFTNGLKGIATMYGVTVDDDIKLDKPAPVGKISLTKGKKISIAKGATITAACSWQNKGGRTLDYDLYAHVTYKDGKSELVNFDNLRSKNGSVVHAGDLRAGGAGTIERVTVKMTDDIACVGFSIYSARENGTGSFSDAKASVALDNGEGSTVTIPVTQMSVDACRYTLYFGTVINRGEHKVEVVAQEDYSARDSERSAVLKADGTHTMDAGPENRYK
jgi:tellurite resistance protein TerA